MNLVNTLSSALPVSGPQDALRFIFQVGSQLKSPQDHQQQQNNNNNINPASSSTPKGTPSMVEFLSVYDCSEGSSLSAAQEGDDGNGLTGSRSRNDSNNPLPALSKLIHSRAATGELINDDDTKHQEASLSTIADTPKTVTSESVSFTGGGGGGGGSGGYGEHPCSYNTHLALLNIASTLAQEVTQRALQRRLPPVDRYEEALLRYVAGSTLAPRLDDIGLGDSGPHVTTKEDDDASDISQFPHSPTANFDEDFFPSSPTSADPTGSVDPHKEKRVLMQRYDTCCDVFGTVPLSSVMDRLSGVDHHHNQQQHHNCYSSWASSFSPDGGPPRSSLPDHHHDTRTHSSSITHVFFNTDMGFDGIVGHSTPSGRTTPASHVSHATVEGVDALSMSPHSEMGFTPPHLPLLGRSNDEDDDGMDLLLPRNLVYSNSKHLLATPNNVTPLINSPLQRRETQRFALTDHHGAAAAPAAAAAATVVGLSAAGLAGGGGGGRAHHYGSGLPNLLSPELSTQNSTVSTTRRCSFAQTTRQQRCGGMPSHVDPHALNLSYCDGLGRRECLIPLFGLLEGYTSATVLNLAGIGLDDAGLNVLVLLAEAYLRSLRHLDLRYNSDITEDSERPIRNLLESCPNVHQVRLYGTSMPTMSMRDISVLAQKNANNSEHRDNHNSSSQLASSDHNQAIAIAAVPLL